MKEVVNDFYVFYDADKVAKAVETMRRAIGKKNEPAAAVKFAQAMLAIENEKLTFKDDTIQSRRALLNTYYKLQAVKTRIQETMEFTVMLAGKVYNEYTAQGGDHYEAVAYANGTERDEERDKALNKPYKTPIETGRAHLAQAVNNGLYPSQYTKLSNVT